MYVLPIALAAHVGEQIQANVAVSQTLSSVMTATTSSITGFVPDLSVFIAAGVVLGLVAMGARRLLKAGR